MASFGLGWLLGGFLFVGGVWGLRAHPVGGVVLFVVGAGSFVLVWLGVLCLGGGAFPFWACNHVKILFCVPYRGSPACFSHLAGVFCVLGLVVLNCFCWFGGCVGFAGAAMCCG